MTYKIFLFCTQIFCLHSIFGQHLSEHEVISVAMKADTLIEDACYHGEHIGLTAGVAKLDGFMHVSTAGLRDLANDLPMTSQTSMRIASISKPLTAVAIMQLFEKGLLDLDAPIQTYVPEFPEKIEGAITTRQLLAHTSGIPHYRSVLDGFSFKYFPTLLDAMDRFKHRDLVHTPGAAYHYSTYGYVVLGVIIEKVSGLTYTEYMAENIWRPAKMQHTSIEHRNQLPFDKSRLYKYKKGRLKRDLNTDISMKIPGGGLQSTAEDLLLFGIALLDGTLLERETLRLMITDQQVRPKEAGNPYGLGWFIYEDGEYGKIFGHSGSQAGQSGHMLIGLDQQIVAVVLSNTRGQWPRTFRLCRQFYQLLTSEDAREAPIPRAKKMPAVVLDRFVGSYEFGDKQILRITRKGSQLYSKMGKYPAIKLFPASESRIFYRDFDAHFQFTYDDENVLKDITYTQNGATSHPTKLE